MNRLLLFVIYATLSLTGLSKNISPADFGLLSAKSDEDRYYALLRCHEVAKKNGWGVSYSGIKKIVISVPQDAVSIPLSSYTDFSNVKLTVNNTIKSFFLFQIWSPTTSIDLDKKQLDSGSFVNDDRLNKGMTLLLLKDGTPWVANRKGYDYGATRRDIMLLKNGRAVNSPVSTYNNISSNPICSFCIAENSQTIISNLFFERAENSTFITNLFDIENQYNVIVSNISIKTPDSNLYGDAIIRIQNSALIKLNNVKIDGTYSQIGQYGYGINLNNIYDLKITNMIAQAKWGVFGTNNVNKAVLYNCDINRFDIHCYGKDVTCKKCHFSKLYNQFSSLFGTLRFVGCTFDHSIPVLFEDSYNAYTPFDIYFDKCTFYLPYSDKCIIMLNGLEKKHNSREELSDKALPNVYMSRCIVHLNEDIKSWNLFDTGRVYYLEPLEYMSKIQINGLKIYGDAELSFFSSPVKTMNQLEISVRGIHKK